VFAVVRQKFVTRDIFLCYSSEKQVKTVY